MPSHDHRLLQRLMEALDAEDRSFKVIRFVARPGSPLKYGATPPQFLGGSNEQRLEVLEAWYSELAALPEIDRISMLNPQVVTRIDLALDELVRLRGAR